jgi:hypothetical protein
MRSVKPRVAASHGRAKQIRPSAPGGGVRGPESKRESRKSAARKEARHQCNSSLYLIVESLRLLSGRSLGKPSLLASHQHHHDSWLELLQDEKGRSKILPVRE